MNRSGYLSCEEIEALRYSILSADLSQLDATNKSKIEQLNSYLIEELTLCSSSRRVDLTDEELELLNEILDKNFEIEKISDLKKIKEEVR